jgi:hypothetical protein
MRRRAEAVYAEAFSGARELQRAVADQPRTHQRSRFDISVAIGDLEHEAGIRYGEVRIPAINLVAGEPRVVAEIFAAVATIGASAVGIAEPWYPDARPLRQAFDAVAQDLDAPDDLMPEHERKLGLGKLSIEDMQVGATHPAGRDLDQNLVRTWSGHR